MHEWALAEAVVESVKREVADHPVVCIDSLVLGFGELQNIDRETFLDGLTYYIPEDLPLSPENVRIESEHAKFTCNKCGFLWTLRENHKISEEELESIHFLPEASHSFISCPSCGSPDFVITGGRGVTIKAINFQERGES